VVTGRAAVIKVLIVDDHAFVRFGVSMLSEQADGITVVGECADGDEVPGAVRAWNPDVVLMDIRMRGTSGLDATRALSAGHPWVRVLMLTASTTGGTVDRAARAGAAGYLIKGGPAQDLVTAVRAVAAGETEWPAHPTGVSSRPAPARTAAGRRGGSGRGDQHENLRTA
jgi:DNA-binding NarL/FixJ family response regulator